MITGAQNLPIMADICTFIGNNGKIYAPEGAYIQTLNKPNFVGSPVL